ncbi:MAG TPA: hypothetical protein VFZ91_04955 [Allosphingosinicella sp.]
MLEYIGPVMALLTAVIGIFYAKTGERQKLGRVAYLLLALILLSGAASIYGVHAAKKKAADDARRMVSERRAAADRAAKDAVDLRRERKAADTFRGISLARAFADPNSVADAILYFDLTQPEDDPDTRVPETDAPPLSAWSPLLGDGAARARLSFNVEDMVEIDYAIAPNGSGVAVEAPYYEYEPKACRLVSEDMLSFAPAAGAPCRRRDGFVYNLFMEPLNATRTLIINLPKNQSFWKLFSRLEQGQRDGGALGSLRIEAETPAAAARILARAGSIRSSVKFFRPFGPGDECQTTLLAHLSLAPKIVEQRVVLLEIKEIDDYELNFCEIAPV